MIKLDVRDAISPKIENWLRDNPKYIRSLTKSIGWFVQKEIKRLSNDTAVTSGWRERMPLKLRRKLADRAPKQWLGKLKKAIGYSYQQSDGSVVIGWTSRTSAMYGKWQEEGAEKPVTDAVRRRFAAREVPLGAGKKTLKLPQRPLYSPAMRIINPKLKAFVDEKVSKWIKNGGFTRNSVPTRKYEVFK